MTASQRISEEQSQLWNGPAGAAWVEAQEMLDTMFAPFEPLLLDGVPGSAGGSLLDVGCGTGAVTLAAARRREGGACLGIDISAPMIATARARAAREDLPARFVTGDAQDYPLEPAAFDAVVSRFGVMFFADPVAAFANLRRSARPGAALRLAVWRSASENPFMTTAERAAAPLLPELPARRADGPGQFAFADRDKVQAIIRESGWTAIAMDPIDVPCVLRQVDLDRYVSRLGPLGLTLSALAPERRAAVLDRVRVAFDPFIRDGEARYEAACWLVQARA